MKTKTVADVEEIDDDIDDEEEGGGEPVPKQIAVTKKKKPTFRKRNSSGSGSLVPILIVGGAVLAGWWYVVNYGPRGAVKNAMGQAVNPSWWDTWFGGAGATTAGTGAGAGTGGTGTATTTPVTTTVEPPGPAMRETDIATATPTYQSAFDAVYQTTVAHGSDPNAMNMDQWSYYYGMAMGSPLSPTGMDAMLQTALTDGYITTREQAIPLGSFMQLLKRFGGTGLADLPPGSSPSPAPGPQRPSHKWGSAGVSSGSGLYNRKGFVN